MQMIEAAMTRSRTVILGLMVILVTGMYAYTTIPKEAEPDIEIPIIYVQMTHEGISPEDAVRQREQAAHGGDGALDVAGLGPLAGVF